MTRREDWQAQVGRSWAENYRLTDRAFTGVTERLLERVVERDCREVLDVGAGAGELSLAISRRQPGARIIGVDVSSDLVEAANERGRERGNVSFVEADAATWRDPSLTPDLVVSRHGVMFFDDPVAAFANFHAMASEDARLIFSCFRSLAENPWAAEPMRLLDLPPPEDPTAPGPFAFADRQRVETILSEAGWTDIGFEPLGFAFISGTGEDAVEEALTLFKRIGPAARALAMADEATRVLAEGTLREWAEAHLVDNLVAFAAAAWIVTARR